MTFWRSSGDRVDGRSIDPSAVNVNSGDTVTLLLDDPVSLLRTYLEPGPVIGLEDDAAIKRTFILKNLNPF
jgi:hypothetical protein